MLDRIIDLVFRNRLLVIVGFILCVSLGVWRMLHTAVDAFPDTTPVQVQVNAVDPALNPIEIEQQLTLPLELAISGLPCLLSRGDSRLRPGTPGKRESIRPGPGIFYRSLSHSPTHQQI